MIDTLAVSDGLLQHESARVAEGRKNVYNTLLISRIGLASLCALGLLAILKYQTAREDERKRLARDLHDELGALLTSAKLDVARIKPRLIGSEPAALGLLAHLVETLNHCVALKRSIIEGLQPSSLSHLGLVATLGILAREFAEKSGVEVHCELAPVKLESTAELVIYRVVQEAITNVAKYAHAHNVWITLGARDGAVHLSVRDDGIGFDTGT